MIEGQQVSIDGSPVGEDGEQHQEQNAVDGAAGDPAPNEKPEEPKAPVVHDEIAKEREKLRLERLEFERAKQDFDARAAAARKEIEDAEAQADQLERFAKNWDERGETETAQAARERAATLRANATAAKEEAKRAEFRQAQHAVLRQVVTEFPDLSNPESPMTKQLDELLRFRPALLAYPEGIRDAAHFVASKQQAARSQAIEKENAELKQKVADLERRLQPAPRGSTSAPRGERPFDKLSGAEQRDALLRAMRREAVPA